MDNDELTQIAMRKPDKIVHVKKFDELDTKLEEILRNFKLLNMPESRY